MAYGAGVLEGRPGLPEPPRETLHVWGMFADLSQARGPSQPISYSEMEAYGRLTGMMPTPWEAEQIKRLDAIALETWAKQAKSKGGARDRASGRDSEGIRRVLSGAARRG